MEFRCIEFEQNGIKLYSTIMSAKDITNEERVKVDIYNASKDQGYQRKPSMNRARDFARYLERAKGIGTTSILLNIRGEIKQFSAIKGPYGVLELPDTTKLWIIDGQHRIEGLKALLQSNASYANFPIAVILINVSSEYEEAKQFIIINKTQKGVRPDLAERFIAKMAKREGPEYLMYLPRATTIDIHWRPKATDIVDILNSSSSEDSTADFYNNPWYQRIQLPNEPKNLCTVSQKAFEDSLKQLLHNASFDGYSAMETAILLVRYWKAIRSLCPLPFEEPKDYVLVRTTGVAVFHNIFPRVVELASKKGKLTLATLAAVLSKMSEGMKELFWDSNGVAGNMGTSKKAFSLLTVKLIDDLEEGNKEEGQQNIRPYAL